MIYVVFAIVIICWIFKWLCKLGLFGERLKIFFKEFDLDHVDLHKKMESPKLIPNQLTNTWYYPSDEDE